ncbi:MAG TPA: hypothetical protein VNW95_08325 [Mucilaginibacter sp.]|jgi:hypothetical protein|nr:hypothetical protein [Mucilaginibacter sp.]
MKAKSLLLIMAGLMLCFAACKKNNLSTIVPNKSVDVYVAGAVRTANNKSEAAYWKNGAIVKLVTDSLSFSSAYGIGVHGTDVYAVGYIATPDFSTSNAVYWKNGVAIKLDNVSNFSEANGIVFQGTDMYVVGSVYNNALQSSQATLWKNGVPTVLAGGSTASAIAITGTDVYIAGVSGTGNNISATYWKNGVAATLTGGLQANAIAISGTDVYIGGNMFNGAAGYWKNGVATTLTNSGVANHAAYDVTGIASNGTDVYVTGSTFFTSAADAQYANSWGSLATFWKNTTPATISASPLNNVAAAVCIYGADVYIVNAGVNNGPDSFVANYWKNGTIVPLSAGGSKGASPGSIIVVAR